jgi:hypothetical protein
VAIAKGQRDVKNRDQRSGENRDQEIRDQVIGLSEAWRMRILISDLLISSL